MTEKKKSIHVLARENRDLIMLRKGFLSVKAAAAFANVPVSNIYHWASISKEIKSIRHFGLYVSKVDLVKKISMPSFIGGDGQKVLPSAKMRRVRVRRKAVVIEAPKE